MSLTLNSKIMKKLWNFFDGNKTTIGAVLMLIVNSQYIESLITKPDLYMLVQGIAGLVFGVGIAHKTKKALKKKK